MPLRRRANARYGGAESPGRPSRERADPGKADTAPKAAPGSRLPAMLAGLWPVAPKGVALTRGGGDPPAPLVVSAPLCRGSLLAGPGVAKRPGCAGACWRVAAIPDAEPEHDLDAAACAARRVARAVSGLR